MSTCGSERYEVVGDTSGKRQPETFLKKAQSSELGCGWGENDWSEG